MMYYHFTRPEYLFEKVMEDGTVNPGIMKSGLQPRVGELNQKVNDKRNGISYSEGEEGLITLMSMFTKTFRELKNANNPRVANIESLDDFLGERVYLAFSSEDIQIENESKLNDERYGKISPELAFAEGFTSKIIPPEILKVCVLRNTETGEITYSRDDILKYMMYKNPVDKFTQGNEEQSNFRKKYYEERKDEIQSMSQYEIEYMEIEEFCKEFSEELRGEKKAENSIDEENKFDRKNGKDSQTIKIAKQAFTGLNNSLVGFENEEEAIREKLQRDVGDKSEETGR